MQSSHFVPLALHCLHPIGQKFISSRYAVIIRTFRGWGAHVQLSFDIFSFIFVSVFFCFFFFLFFFFLNQIFLLNKMFREVELNSVQCIFKGLKKKVIPSFWIKFPSWTENISASPLMMPATKPSTTSNVGLNPLLGLHSKLN